MRSGSAVACLLLAALVRAGPPAAPTPVAGRRTSLPALAAAELSVVDRMAQIYGSTDLSPLVDAMAAAPADVGNANDALVWVALAAARTGRWTASGDREELSAALDALEFLVDHYSLWGMRPMTGGLAPLSAGVVSRLDVVVLSLDRHDAAMPEDLAARSRSVRRRAEEVSAQEANYLLTIPLPLLPLDSSAGGDGKGEENAYVSAAFAAAAALSPGDPNAPAWEARGRQTAYDAITTASDPPDSFGYKTVTVTESFDVPNHGISPNAFYTAMILFELQQGALLYRLAGWPVPREYFHHVGDLYARYKTFCVVTDGAWAWNSPKDLPSDPTGGDPTDFPLPMAADLAFELTLVQAKVAMGGLWQKTPPALSLARDYSSWIASQNSKVALIYAESRLWRLEAGGPASGR